MLFPLVGVITKISPVESLDMNRLPLGPQAKPTGRKQRDEQLDKFGFSMIGMMWSLLFGGATG